MYSFKKLVGFECRQLKQPYLSRQELAYKQVAENCYQVQLPEGFVYETNQFAVTFDDYSEIGVKGLKKLVG